LISTTKGYRRETDPFDCVRMNTPANGLITSWIIVHTFTKYFEQESYQWDAVIETIGGSWCNNISPIIRRVL
jgi:hypothetical protein